MEHHRVHSLPYRTPMQRAQPRRSGTMDRELALVPVTNQPATRSCVEAVTFSSQRPGRGGPTSSGDPPTPRGHILQKAPIAR